MSVLPTFFSKAARIRLTPHAASAMNADDYTALEARATTLGVEVSTVYRTRDKHWMVRVTHGAVTTSLVARGPLAAIVNGALDDFEAAA